MNESRQPFTEHVTRTRGNRGSRAGWFLAALLGLLALGLLWLWLSSRTERYQLASLKSQLNDSAAALAEARAENETNRNQIVALKSQIADLEKEKEQVANMARGLEEEMRADLESKDVTISRLQGKLTVSILDRVMFDSGEAILKPGGETVMRKIGTLLTEHPELKIHVIGHTDNVPIRPEAHSRFMSNWELSMARALAAVHFLTEKAGVDPHRVGAVGYGEYRPIADNSTVEGRARNRRIAVTILPDELAAADSGVPKAGALTTSPPGALETGTSLPVLKP
jgi:chemotaxis protein MotB